MCVSSRITSVVPDAPVLLALLVMRVYAMYIRNKWVLTLVAVEALVAMGIALVSTFHLCDQDAHMSTVNSYSGFSLDHSQIPARAYLRSEPLLLPKLMTCHQHHSFTSRGKFASRRTIIMSLRTFQIKRPRLSPVYWFWISLSLRFLHIVR